MIFPEAPTAIILAAGRSQRMGEQNKLFLEIGGQPVLARVLRAFAEAPVDEIIVVTGMQHERVSALVVAGSEARVAYNPDFPSGMASSIRRGIRAAAPEVAGYALCPGDLPLLSGHTVDRLCQIFAVQTAPRIVAPTYEGQQGHPVLFGTSFREELLEIEGDRGARCLLRRDEAPLTRVPVHDDGILRDVDTPEALKRVRQRAAQEEATNP